MNNRHTTTVDCTVVLPLYNEGLSLVSNLEHILATLAKGKFSFEMLLIDDRSSDETPTVARVFAAQHAGAVRFFLHERNLGRGATVTEGFRIARGRVMGFIDVDCEASPHYVLDFVPDLLAGEIDGITGLRIYPFSIANLGRAFASAGYRLLERLLLHTPFRDSQTGYKFFRRAAIAEILEVTRDAGWFWDTEIMALCHLADLKIEERPIVFLRNRQKKSTVRLFRDTIRMIDALVRFRRRFQEFQYQVPSNRQHGRESTADTATVDVLARCRASKSEHG